MTTSDKRRTILLALEKVIRGRRLDEVTVDQVTAEAGVGKGTVYRYFEDKEDLFFQMIHEFLQEETDAVSVVAASALAPREKFVRVGETICEHIREHGAVIRMMHAQSGSLRKHRDPREIMAEHHKRQERIISQLFHDAIESGLIRSEVNESTFICLFKGMLLERAMGFIHERTDIPSVDQLVDMLLTGAGQS